MTIEAPRYRRLTPDQRRSQILAVAVKHFGEQPYATVSTQAIADEAGVGRGLVHHYFGAKRDIYLEVVRAMMFVPPGETLDLPTTDLRERTEIVIDWLLDVIETNGRTWVAVSGAEGVVSDPEVQAILDEADDVAAAFVLDTLLPRAKFRNRQVALASVRCYGGMTKAAAREWIVRGGMDRRQIRAVLAETLFALVDSTIDKR